MAFVRVAFVRACARVCSCVSCVVCVSVSVCKMTLNSASWWGCAVPLKQTQLELCSSMRVSHSGPAPCPFISTLACLHLFSCPQLTGAPSSAPPSRRVPGREMLGLIIAVCVMAGVTLALAVAYAILRRKARAHSADPARAQLSVLRQNMTEAQVNLSELEFGRMLGKGSQGEVFKAQWYADHLFRFLLVRTALVPREHRS